MAKELRRVYLDNNATTKMCREAREAYISSKLDANASSMYSSARVSMEAVKEAREYVANLVGTNAENIIFTSGATESNNTVLNIAVDIIEKNKKGCILSTTIEHPSIREKLKHIAKKGIKVIECPVDSRGRLKLEEYEKLLFKEKPVLSTVMTANNETGTIQPVDEACALAHKYGCLFHTDATQAMGKLDFDFDKSAFDYASISAHKFYGPKGIGALIVKKGSPFVPFLIGGHQEDGRRASTYNSNAIAGMGMAAKVAKEEIAKESEKLSNLRNLLKKGIEDKIEGVSFNGDDEHCLPGTLNVSFKNIEGESILLMLDFEGIEVSTGSACASGSLEPSYVLLASGVPIENAHSSIRFSFGRYNTFSDVKYVLECLPAVVKRLRQISTK